MTAPKSLKSLTFAALPKPEVNPVQERRTRTIARLEEQKQLFNDPKFTRTVRISVKGEDGARSVVEKQQRVLPESSLTLQFLPHNKERWRPMFAFDVVTINRLCSAALPECQKTALQKTALVVIANSSAGRRSGGNDARTKRRLRPLWNYPPRRTPKIRRSE